MNKALTALHALQQVDSALALAQRRYRALDPGRAEQAAAESARETHAHLSQASQETVRELRDAELELKTVEGKKKDFEAKLYSGKVQAFKELEAIQQEIEALGRQRGRLDEKILVLMEQVETLRAQEAEAKAKLDAAESALARKQAEHKAAARALAERIRALTAEREKRAAVIPPPLLKRYDALRAAKQGVGIARIEDGLCGACHTSLPTNLIRAVEETESVEICENCGRMLCGEEG